MIHLWVWQAGLRCLLLFSLLLAASNSNASEVETAPVLVAPAPEPAPAQSQTSPNLIDNNNWDGATYGNDPGGCCASVSGSGALYDNHTDTIMFSYGQDILSQTIAINQALQQSGVQVDGYNYGWTWRTISNNGNGGDTLQFEVTVKDASGNEVERYVYDYSSSDHAMDVWHIESGTETFTQSYLDPQSIALKIIGKDGGFWAGYYGPEVKDVSLTLNYSANPCAADPLYDPSCEGYADAYAQQQYDLNCQADPLYDPGCPGYAQAYETQQCNADPLYSPSCSGYQQAYYDQQCSLDALYDSGCPGYQQAYYDQQCSLDPFYDTSCPGYAQAYYDQQCSINPLYDSGCTGYAEAYYDQQCSISALYDSGCPGYAQAYYDQQCSLDALYDSGCPGYEEKYFATYVQPGLDAQANEAAGVSSDPTASTTTDTTALVDDPIAALTEPSSTGDSITDSVLRETSNVSTTIELPGMVETTPPAGSNLQTDTPSGSEPEAATAAEPSAEAELEAELASLDEGATNEEEVSKSSDNVDESSDGGSNSEGNSESGDGNSGEGSKDEKSEDAKSEEKLSPEEAKRKKLKEIATKRAMMLAETMGEAATLAQQQAVQAQIAALINFVPGFNAYGQVGIPGGDMYANQPFYEDERVPENQRGLRNGLAQQLLHEKMVEQQYELGAK